MTTASPRARAPQPPAAVPGERPRATEVIRLDAPTPVAPAPPAHPRSGLRGRLRAGGKRALDVSLALLGLSLGAPLWALAAVAIFCEGGRPLLHRQQRWGRRGRPFTVLKMRTMIHDADAGGVRPASAADPRVTRVGRVLRACGLDELPQLVNILRGQMSLVGPRALAIGEVLPGPDGARLSYEEVPGFHDRHAVRPGLTGPAAIHLPKDAHPLAKLDYDLRYAREWTLGLDLRLIAMSLWISLRGRWESREPKL